MGSGFGGRMFRVSVGGGRGGEHGFAFQGMNVCGFKLAGSAFPSGRLSPMAKDYPFTGTFLKHFKGGFYASQAYSML